jgi:hypothetical protein
LTKHKAKVGFYYFQFPKMLTNAALGLLFALAFLCGQAATAVLLSGESHYVLEVQETGYSQSLFRADCGIPDEPKRKAKGRPCEERLAKTDWKVDCGPETDKHKCDSIKDDNLNTVWLAKGSSSTPHWITIELKESVYVHGIGVFTHQERNSDGVFTSHEVYLSDGREGLKQAKPVAYGNWWNDKLSDDGKRTLAESSGQSAPYCQNGTATI